MSPIARRVNAPAQTSGGTVNFGADGFFTGAIGLPEGNYACSFSWQIYQPVKADGTPSKTPAFLAAIGEVTPIDQQGNALGEPTEMVLSCGRDAHESFLPSEDGKGLVGVPNGKSAGIWSLSNFAIFFDSLKQVGLPPGLISASLEPLDGVWLHLTNIPEPEQKKAAAKKARAKTGMSAIMSGGQQDDDRERTVIVATEILEGGKPWEGTGGIPDGSAPKAAPKKAATPAAKKTVAAPAPAAPAATDDETVGTAALETVAQVLGSYPQGMTKVNLRVQAFQALTKTYGDEIAQAAQALLQTDDMLTAVLGEVGYKIVGLMVKPA